jgi:HSP20 family protein
MFSPFGFNPYFNTGYPGVWRDPFEDLLDEDVDLGGGEGYNILPQQKAHLSKAARRKQRRQQQQLLQSADSCAECGGSGRQLSQQQQLQTQQQGNLNLRRQQQQENKGQLTTQRGGGLSALIPEAFQQPLDVQLSEENDRFVIRANLAGVPQDKINLSIDEGYLNLDASRQHTAKDQQSSFSFVETLSRSFPLPAGVNENQVQANWRDGQLEVVVPKPAAEKQQLGGRKIAISGTSAAQEKLQQAPISQTMQQQSLQA